jgi:hypothetical protein
MLLWPALYHGGMTTPTPPTLSISTDQATYAPGDTVTLAALYTDPNGTSFTVEVTANATDSNTPPNTATGTTSFNVAAPASELMTITVSDTAGDTYSEVSNVPGQAVFTTTAPSAL